MNAKMQKIYDKWRCLMNPKVNDEGIRYCVSARNGGGCAYFEDKKDAKYFADSMNEKTKAKTYKISEEEVTGFNIYLNGNIEADFERFWDLWLGLTHFAENIVNGLKLPEGNRRMIAVYAGCLWFFRKAMKKAHKDHQETMKALESLKRRIDELEEMI